MPINDGTGIMPGVACRACIHLVPEEGIDPCPWGNSKYPDKITMFLGDDFIVGNTCHSYLSYEDIGLEADSENSLVKTAATMTESQLKVALYRKVMALKEKDRNKLYNYWDYLLPSDYAEEMVDETTGTAPKQKDKKRKKKRERNKFDDGFKRKKGD